MRRLSMSVKTLMFALAGSAGARRCGAPASAMPLRSPPLPAAAGSVVQTVASDDTQTYRPHHRKAPRYARQVRPAPAPPARLFLLYVAPAARSGFGGFGGFRLPLATTIRRTSFQISTIRQSSASRRRCSATERGFRGSHTGCGPPQLRRGNLDSLRGLPVSRQNRSSEEAACTPSPCRSARRPRGQTSPPAL